MKILSLFAVILLSLALAGCDSSDSSKEADVLALTSIVGKTVKITVSSGAGGFASKGSAMIAFSSITNQYVITGDEINVGDSAGTFSYSSSGNKATLAMDDSALGKNNFYLTFTSTDLGTYIADAAQVPSATQIGSFEVQR